MALSEELKTATPPPEFVDQAIDVGVVGQGLDHFDMGLVVGTGVDIKGILDFNQALQPLVAENLADVPHPPP
jgi:hypothetical protein